MLVLLEQSRSCSTCQSSTPSDESEYERRKGRPEKREDERRKPENIRNEDERRRYCVIVLPGEDNETREVDKDEHKEEMTYDHDDYPSSTSNDSNDGLNNMEKRPTEDENREYYAASNIEANEITESDKVGVGQLPRNKPGCDIDQGGINDMLKNGEE
uniref:Uncharacterized protein n=1 Tax=Populus alba TaxID=43335 RepID=A0A4U5NT22_POPAL|nr:hypothetical protein D5086_0000239430 [Populus alba]